MPLSKQIVWDILFQKNCNMEIKSKTILGITGGIGSGKSVVCGICKAKGLPVYDCDSNAKRLMNTSDEIKNSLQSRFGQKAIIDNEINKKLIAEKIFTDESHRLWLNTIVHTAVREDIINWVKVQTANIICIESAILHTSHLDEMVNQIWLVDAPDELRINRVAKRDNLSSDEIKKRIAVQRNEFTALPAHKISKIDNSDKKSLLLQINQLLEKISN